MVDDVEETTHRKHLASGNLAMFFFFFFLFPDLNVPRCASQAQPSPLPRVQLLTRNPLFPLLFFVCLFCTNVGDGS